MAYNLKGTSTREPKKEKQWMFSNIKITLSIADIAIIIPLIGLIITIAAKYLTIEKDLVEINKKQEEINEVFKKIDVDNLEKIQKEFENLKTNQIIFRTEIDILKRKAKL